MLRRIYKFYRNHKYSVNGAVLGLIAGVLLAFAGFWKTLVILVCVGAGYFVGRKLQEDKNYIKKLLDKLLPPGLYK